MTNILIVEREHGKNGIDWLFDLIINPPEEISHEQLSPPRFSRK
ncbi:MAG: hypothetical protein ACJAUG_002703 [Halioglobus sp.]|jgi:hypothetical protein